ncbi:uncharacterized protein LOC124816380 [Hydra vulgaris]|uniref:uncharacterized protein LOC124816380 n=1 Tax=Hydra vulgaris TaxID=6087 RepID=UPI0032E9ECDF
MFKVQKMSKVKKMKENKKYKVKRKLFIKPVAIVKPYVPEGTYKIPQAYIPQVVETRPLERIDQQICEDELEIFDDIPEIDDEQVRILDNIMIRIDRHLEDDDIMIRNDRYFATPRRVICFGCCLCDEESVHNHCCTTTVCPYVQGLFERCRGCCYCL